MKTPTTSWSIGRRKQHYKHTKEGTFSRTRAFRKLSLGEFKNFPEQAFHGHKAWMVEIMLHPSPHLALSLMPLSQCLYLRMWSYITCADSLTQMELLLYWGLGRGKKKNMSLNIPMDQTGGWGTGRVLHCRQWSSQAQQRSLQNVGMEDFKKFFLPLTNKT